MKWKILTLLLKKLPVNITFSYRCTILSSLALFVLDNFSFKLQFFIRCKRFSCDLYFFMSTVSPYLHIHHFPISLPCPIISQFPEQKLAIKFFHQHNKRSQIQPIYTTCLHWFCLCFMKKCIQRRHIE
jgi:hypothetical protein